MSLVSSRPELLAPAGDLQCARAAVENGADAIYFGLDRGFNARARATNISLDSLPTLLELLHRRGVRGYLTLNTLVFSDELAEFEETARAACLAGVDAVLVQDLGVARLLGESCPDLPLHASTQMTLTSALCAKAVEGLGLERIVLPRELSIDEIRQFHQGTPTQLEAFAHGALCVAYSGQCMTSESLGGRSANRGQCAQACRLPYELVCDGQDVDLGDVQYLLSPQDLAAYALIPEMIEAGVTCLKIEGRLKTPEYVANITRHYREAIDSAIAGREVRFTRRQVEEMELSFSRGFSPGWLEGCDHKRLVPGLSSAKRGVHLGEVTALGDAGVKVRLSGFLKPGDGVAVTFRDASSDTVVGGRVYEMWRRGRKVESADGGEVELRFGRGAIDLRQLSPGMQLWKTDDPHLTQRLRKSFADGGRPRRRLPLRLAVTAEAGSRLTIRGELPGGVAGEVHSDKPLEAARKHPLTESVLNEQLGRLGGTPLELAQLTARIEGEPMAPLSVLNQLRQRLVAQLLEKLSAPPRRSIAPEPVLPRLRAGLAAARLEPPTENAELRLLCRSPRQLRLALEAGQRQLIAEFQDIRQYREAVEEANASGAELWIATPRIHKPGETGVLRMLAKAQPAGVLVRNLAALAFFREAGLPVAGDFSLNAANELTVQWLIEQGLAHTAVSYDLNRDQLLALLEHCPPQWLEVVIHQHMPMFHMEHCVFCAVLSPGTNKTNCGRPCDDHQVSLRDRVGKQHRLHADVGCRNTLYNATPQSAAEVVPQLLGRGVRRFRVELLDDLERPELRELLDLYRGLLEGRLHPREVWTRLRASNRVGVTRGTLEERRDPLAIL